MTHAEPGTYADSHAEDPPDVVDHVVTDVLTEDEVVHVPAAGAELAEALDHHNDSTFVGDLPDWDADDPQP